MLDGIPEWSPIAHAGGYGAPLAQHGAAANHNHVHHLAWDGGALAAQHGFWSSGCDCFAFSGEASQMKREPGESPPFGYRSERSLLHSVER
jgi:hypothetical protein